MKSNNLPDPDVARERLAGFLAQGGSLEFAHVVAEPESDTDDPEAEFNAVVEALRNMAMAGIMPRMTTWDAAKPVHLPNAKKIINTYRKGWNEMATITGLKMDRRYNPADSEPVYTNGTHAKEPSEATPAAPEAVDHPKHYNQHPSGIECIEIVRHMNFNLGNVVKYLWRAGLKDGVVDLEDLKKARWYLDDEIKRREGQS